MHLDRNFLEFIECCAVRDVRFLIVGGYALAAHGHPRYTKDLDVWILMDQTNADRALAAIADFGFGGAGRLRICSTRKPSFRWVTHRTGSTCCLPSTASFSNSAGRTESS